jgi:hypothetical protein
MGHQARLKTAVFLVVVVGISGCMPERQKGVDIPREPMVILPQPGAKYVIRPQDPAFQSLCVGASAQRFLTVNEVRVEPARVRAGHDINNRFVYTLCPRGQSSVTGRLTTTISQGGSVILSEPVDGYRLGAGQWAVDARITVPPEAPPGDYTLTLSFAGGGASFNGSADFTVY